MTDRKSIINATAGMMALAGIPYLDHEHRERHRGKAVTPSHAKRAKTKAARKQRRKQR
jgi:hypothetical protein